MRLVVVIKRSFTCLHYSALPLVLSVRFFLLDHMFPICFDFSGNPRQRELSPRPLQLQAACFISPPPRQTNNKQAIVEASRYSPPLSTIYRYDQDIQIYSNIQIINIVFLTETFEPEPLKALRFCVILVFQPPLSGQFVGSSAGGGPQTPSSIPEIILTGNQP